MTTKTEDSQPGAFHDHKVVHLRQQYNWDCGVTCCLMLLDPDQREEALNNFNKICLEEGFGQSTWTIDLCYLLKRFNIDHAMYTTFAGVNDEYKKHGYYRDVIDLDRERVRSRFSSAAADGIVVHEQRVSSEQLAEHLATRGPAIVLVDANRLACDICKHNKLRVELGCCVGEYSGHYVVATGSGVAGSAGGSGACVRYRDPARDAGLCAARGRCWDAARGAEPTDDDVILIYKSFT